MVRKYQQVTTRHSAEMAALHQNAGVKTKRLCELFPQYSRRNIYRHASRPIAEDCPLDLRKKNSGRPPKLTEKDKRNILRAVQKLRVSCGYFTSGKIKVEANLSNKVSNRTIRRVLNNAGYKYLRSRKKGLLKASDLKNRLKFCRMIKKKKLGKTFWTEGISFYLDGKGYEFKTNPNDEARAPKACQWRRKSEGLEFGLTAKGKKEGAVNRNFMVGISYNKGVVLCEEYFGAINGKKMVRIVDEHFPQAFENSIDPKGKRFLTDNCPRQTCKVAMAAYDRVNAKVFRIPPRSPDLNPIENFFHLVTNKLKEDALQQNITHETKLQFSERVIRTMKDFPVEKINNLIGSMDKRIEMVIKAKGKRIRY